MTKTYNPDKLRITDADGRVLFEGQTVDIKYVPQTAPTVETIEPAELTWSFEVTPKPTFEALMDILKREDQGMRLKDVMELRRRWLAEWPEVERFLSGRFLTGNAVTRHSPRGGGLIPDDAFSPRRGPARPTTERTYARENIEPDATRLVPGCYHAKAVRYDEAEVKGVSNEAGDNS